MLHYFIGSFCCLCDGMLVRVYVYVKLFDCPKLNRLTTTFNNQCPNVRSGRMCIVKQYEGVEKAVIIISVTNKINLV